MNEEEEKQKRDGDKIKLDKTFFSTFVDLSFIPRDCVSMCV